MSLARRSFTRRLVQERGLEPLRPIKTLAPKASASAVSPLLHKISKFHGLT